MDPVQQDAGFRLDRVAGAAGPRVTPADPDAVARALTGYARAFERLLAGYYILDRNYNYDFHNRLFLRSTPLLPTTGPSAWTGCARPRRFARPQTPSGGGRAAAIGRPTIRWPPRSTTCAAYAAFTFDRAPVLERMSAEFEQTEAGLQHATHLYEGEGKMLGVRLAELLAKHQRCPGCARASPPSPPSSQAISRAVHDVYANRIVGF